MLEMIMMIGAICKMIFNSNHTLSMLICLELMNLTLISMLWQYNWSITLWFMAMSVIHSVFGLLILLLIIRYYGNDKSINLY